MINTPYSAHSIQVPTLSTHLTRSNSSCACCAWYIYTCVLISCAYITRWFVQEVACPRRQPVQEVKVAGTMVCPPPSTIHCYFMPRMSWSALGYSSTCSRISPCLWTISGQGVACTWTFPGIYVVLQQSVTWVMRAQYVLRGRTNILNFTSINRLGSVSFYV